MCVHMYPIIYSPVAFYGVCCVYHHVGRSIFGFRLKVCATRLEGGIAFLGSFDCLYRFLCSPVEIYGLLYARFVRRAGASCRDPEKRWRRCARSYPRQCPRYSPFWLWCWSFVLSYLFLWFRWCAIAVHGHGEGASTHSVSGA